MLELIANNKGDLESLTSGKVNISDIVNNLTTNNEAKVLSAAQGVVLKALIDEMQLALDGKSDSNHVHTISEITDLQTTLTNAANAISTNTSSINAHTDRISALETKVGDGFEEITSEDIRSLFNN